MANSNRLKWLARSALAGVLLASGFSAVAQGQEASRAIELNMPAQPLSEALRAFARTSGEQIVFSEDLVDGKQAPALSGPFTSDAALSQLLNGSGLVARRTARGAIMILSGTDPRAQRSGSIDTEEGASSTQHADAQAPATDDSSATSEILVQGHRTQNADIRRTRDDIQPYVVFDAQQIASSGAVNLEEFLARHLPQNTQNNTSSQLAGSGVGPNLITGNINLRGLGANQTLILVDGRRLPDVYAQGGFQQPDINAIPPASIERIEILPATASGIYGGGATGGVINIILKRDYSGLDLSVGYGNTFDTDASNSNITLSGGRSFNNDNTHITFSVSHAAGSQLLSSDRDFDARRADILLRTSPTSFFPYGSSVCSTVDAYVGANSCDGGPLVLDDGTPLNSNRTFVPRGYAGAAATGDGGAAFLANAGLVDTSYDPIPIYTGATTDALSLNVRHTFSSWLEGYFDFSRDSTKSSWQQAQVAQVILPGASPDNPFQQDVLVNVPLPGILLDNSFSSTTLSAIGGAIVRLPHDWSASLEYQWTKNVSNNYFAQPLEISATGPSTLSPVALSDTRGFTDASVFDLFAGGQPSGNRLATYSARLSGPLFQLPGGDVTMSALLEHRDQRTDGQVFGGYIFGPTYDWVPAATEQVGSEYAEVRVPVVSSANALPLVEVLDFTAAVRHDAYDFDYPGFQIAVAGPNGPFPPTTNATSSLNSTDYTFGLRYAPVHDLTFRASYGTGFLPPAMAQFAFHQPTPYPAYYYNLSDPRRGGELVTGDSSGNISFGSYATQGVQPEESRSFSYGFIFTPEFLTGLRISVDFTETHKTNEIVGYIAPQDLVNLEAIYPDRIVRGPNLPGDPVGYPGPIVGIDSGALNAAKSDIRSIDFQIDYNRHTDRFGDWHFYVIGSEQTRLQRTLFPGAASQNFVGLQNGPVKWKGVFGLDWTQGPWTLGWDAQYTDAFSPCSSYFIGTPQCAVLEGYQGRNHLGAQLYNDLNVRYVFAQSDHAWGRMLDGAEINLGIQNVFNEEPPVYGIPNINYTGIGDPRLRRFTLTLREHF